MPLGECPDSDQFRPATCRDDLQIGDDPSPGVRVERHAYRNAE